MSDPRAWFQAKAFGIGWTPRTWEGWAVIAAVIAVGALARGAGRLNDGPAAANCLPGLRGRVWLRE